MSRLSSTDTPVEEEAEVVESDEAREALLAKIQTELGDAVVGSHLSPGDDLWVRVDRSAWPLPAPTSRPVSASSTSTSFGHRLEAFAFGRDMDAQVDLSLGHDEASEIDMAIEQGVAGGDTRFQVFAQVNDIVNGLGVTLKADVPDDDLSIDSWVTVYAGANWHERDAGRCTASPSRVTPASAHLPAGRIRRQSAAQGLPLLARRLKPWPGIVDVEQMPGDDDPADAAETTEAAE